DVRAVVDRVRRDRMAPPVPGQERDPAVRHGGEEERVRRGAVRSVDLDLADVVEERVEARTTEDADLGLVRHGCLLGWDEGPPILGAHGRTMASMTAAAATPSPTSPET